MTLEEYKQRFGVAPGVRDRLKGVGNIMRPFAEAMSGLAYPQQSRPAAAAPQGQQPASIYSDLERLALQPDDQKFMAGTGATEQEANLAIGPMAARADAELAPQPEAVAQAPRGSGVFTNNEEWTPERLSASFDAPLQKGDIRIGNAGEDGAFRGTLEDYRSYREALMKDEEMAGRRQATMGYQTQDQRDGIDRNTMTATQIGDKRELDRRMALIETMPEGPGKEDELAKIRNEATAKRAAGVKDTDRFTGSIGSPDHKAREGRMAAYEQNLKALRDGRLITKGEEKRMAKENRKEEMDKEALAIDRIKAEAMRDSAIATNNDRARRDAEHRLSDYHNRDTQADKANNRALGLTDDWGVQFNQLRNGLISEMPKEEEFANALIGMSAENSQFFMQTYQGMKESGIDSKTALTAALLRVGIAQPKKQKS